MSSENSITQSQTANPTKPYEMAFNQDKTCLSVGTDSGYKLYNLSRLPNKLDLLFKDDVENGTSHVNRLFTSSLVAYRSRFETNKIFLAHFRKNQIICDYTYPSPVRTLQLNRNRLIVCLDNEIYIHAIKDMSLVHIIKDVATVFEDKVNTVSLASPMSASALSNLIAYPLAEGAMVEVPADESSENNSSKNSKSNSNSNNSNNLGRIAIFDAYLLRTIKVIDAHENRISATCFANNSTFRAGSQENPLLLASASERGTVIRIWSIPQGICIHELRRGMYHADIQQLSFSLDAEYVGLISKNQTIHVWDLMKKERFAEKKEKVEGETSETTPEAAAVADDSVITDAQLEQMQQEEENIYKGQTSTNNNTWFNYFSNIFTSYMDATYNLTTGGVITRADFSCKIPDFSKTSSQSGPLLQPTSAQSFAILKNYILLTTNDHRVIIYDFKDSKKILQNRNTSDENTTTENLKENENDPGYGSIECQQLNVFNLLEDNQTAILQSNVGGRIKSLTENGNEKVSSGKSFASAAKKSGNKGHSGNKKKQPMTRGTSRQIELDLRN